MADDVGGIYVTVRPDDSGFRDDLKAKLEEDTRGLDQAVKVHIDADDDDFTVTYDEVKVKGRDLGNQKYSPTFGADDTDLRAKLDENQERAKALAAETFKLKFDADDAKAKADIDELRQKAADLVSESYPAHVTLDGNDAVAAKLDDLEAKLDEFGARHVTATVSVDGADGGAKSLDNFSRSADGAGKSAENASEGALSLVSAAIALGPALIPIGAVATAGLGGIAALAGSAAAGLGAFALAASGDLGSVETSAKSMLAAFQEANKATVLSALTDVLPTLQEGFADIEPLVQGAAQAIGQFGKIAAESLTSPFWESFFQLLGGQARQSLTAFGNLAVGVGTALAGLDRAFAPVITSITGGLDRMGASLQHFGLTAGSNSGLEAFIAYVQREAPQVLQVLGVLGSDLLTLGEDAGRLGPAFLSVIGGIGSLLGDLERLNPDLTEAAIAALSLYKAFQILGPAVSVLKDVANIGTLFTGATGADSAASGLGKAAVSAGQFQRSITEAGLAAGVARVDFASLSEAADAAAAGITTAAAQADEGFANWARGALAAGSTVKLASAEMATATRAAATETVAAGEEADVAGEAMGVGFDAALGPIGLVAAGVAALVTLFHHTNEAANQFGSTFAQSFAQANPSIEAQRQEVQKLTDAQAALEAATTETTTTYGRFGPVVSTGSDATNAQKKSMDDDSSSISALNKQIAEGIAKQAGLGAATSLTKTVTETLGEKLASAGSAAQQFAVRSQAVNSALQAESTAATNASNAINVLVGNYLSGKAATLAQQQAVYSFADALKAAKGNLTGNSEASVAAEQAAQSFASQLFTQTIPALAKQGDSEGAISAASAGFVAAFDAKAHAIGLTASQVAQLNTTYGLTPKTIDTAIKTEGLSGAIKDANHLKGVYDAIPTSIETHITVTTSSGTSTAQVISPGQLTIPGRAMGDDNFKGGLAWVGEQGPELMQLPAGTKIASNPKSMALVQSGRVAAPGFAGGLGESSLFDKLNVSVAAPNSLAGQSRSGNDVGVGVTSPAGGGIDAYGQAWRAEVNKTLDASNYGWDEAGHKFHDSVVQYLNGQFLDGLHELTPQAVSSITDTLSAMSAEVQNHGLDIIDELTKTTKTVGKGKNAKSEVVSLPGDTLLSQAQVDEIGSKLPKAIGDAIEKQGPQTVSQLKALYNKLDKDVDVDAVAKKLPNAIVDALDNAGPLTAAKFKSTTDDLIKTLNAAGADISKGLAGSTTQLTTYVNDAKASVDKAFKGTAFDNVVDGLAKQYDYLASKAKDSLAAITTQLSAAQTGLASIKSQIAQSASTLEGQDNITSIAGSTATNPYTGSTFTSQVTGANIISSLQTDVASLKKYRSLLDTLKSWGLSNELLAELVAAGPASGLAAAEALVAGGKKEVSLADVLQGQIDSQSTAIATISAQASIGGKEVGLAQANGIVSSLEKSKAQITSELDKLAKDINVAFSLGLRITGGKSKDFEEFGKATMDGFRDGMKGAEGPVRTELETISKSLEKIAKDALGIKSPSTVFAAIGTNVVQGLAQGISGNTKLLDDALADVYGTLTSKSKQKALQFAPPTIAGLGGSVTPVSVSSSPTIIVQGDATSNTVALIDQKLVDYTNRLQREIGW